VILSVPHSGTHTLHEHLYGYPNPVNLIHFGHPIVQEIEWPDIPLRDPWQITLSWVKRGKPISRCFDAIDHMIEYCEGRDVTFYPIEQFNFRRNHNPREPKNTDSVRAEFDRWMSNSHKNWYLKHGYTL